MDFKSMKRRQLQSLCKKHGIPANSTSSEMIERLSSIFQSKERVKVKGCLKVSNGSSAEDLGKKVTFVAEDEVDDEIEVLTKKSVGKSKRKFTGSTKKMKKEESVNCTEGVQKNAQPVALGEVAAARSLRSRVVVVGGDEELLSDKNGRGTHKRKYRDNKQEKDDEHISSKQEKGVFSQVPLTRSLRNRTVVAGRDEALVSGEKGRRTLERKISDKKEDTENVDVGKTNLRKRSRDGDPVKDEPPPSRERVDTEEVGAERGNKRRKVTMEDSVRNDVVEKQIERASALNDVVGQKKKDSRGNNHISKMGEPTDSTLDGKVVSGPARRSTRGSSAASIMENQVKGQGDSARLLIDNKVIIEPLRRPTRSSSAVVDDGTFLHDVGKSVKKETNTEASLQDSRAVAEPVRRSTRSSSALLTDGSSLSTTGESVNKANIVSFSDSMAVVEPKRRSTCSSSKLLEDEASLPEVGKLGSDDAAKKDKPGKQPKHESLKGGKSERSLSGKEAVPTRRSTRSSSKSLEDEDSFPAVTLKKDKLRKRGDSAASDKEVVTSPTRILGNDSDPVRMIKSGKQATKHASRAGDATVPGEEPSTTTRRLTGSSSKLSEAEASSDSDAVRKHKSRKRETMNASKPRDLTPLLPNKLVTTSTRRPTRSSSKLDSGTGEVRNDKSRRESKGAASKLISPIVAESRRRLTRGTSIHDPLEDETSPAVHPKFGYGGKSVQKNKSGKQPTEHRSKNRVVEKSIPSSIDKRASGEVEISKDKKAQKHRREDDLKDQGSVASSLDSASGALEVHEHHEKFQSRSTRSASKHGELHTSTEKKGVRESYFEEDMSAVERETAGGSGNSRWKSLRKVPVNEEVVQSHLASNLEKDIQEDSHVNAKSLDVNDVDGTQGVDSQNITDPLTHLECSKEPSKTFDGKISPDVDIRQLNAEVEVVADKIYSEADLGQTNSEVEVKFECDNTMIGCEITQVASPQMPRGSPGGPSPMLDTEADIGVDGKEAEDIGDPLVSTNFEKLSPETETTDAEDYAEIRQPNAEVEVNVVADKISSEADLRQTNAEVEVHVEHDNIMTGCEVTQVASPQIPHGSPGEPLPTFDNEADIGVDSKEAEDIGDPLVSTNSGKLSPETETTDAEDYAEIREPNAEVEVNVVADKISSEADLRQTNVEVEVNVELDNIMMGCEVTQVESPQIPLGRPGEPSLTFDTEANIGVDGKEAEDIGDPLVSTNSEKLSPETETTDAEDYAEIRQPNEEVEVNVVADKISSEADLGQTNVAVDVNVERDSIMTGCEVTLVASPQIPRGSPGGPSPSLDTEADIGMDGKEAEDIGDPLVSTYSEKLSPETERTDTEDYAEIRQPNAEVEVNVLADKISSEADLRQTDAVVEVNMERDNVMTGCEVTQVASPQIPCGSTGGPLLTLDTEADIGMDGKEAEDIGDPLVSTNCEKLPPETERTDAKDYTEIYIEETDSKLEVDGSCEDAITGNEATKITDSMNFDSNAQVHDASESGMVHMEGSEALDAASSPLSCERKHMMSTVLVNEVSSDVNLGETDSKVDTHNMSITTTSDDFSIETHGIHGKASEAPRIIDSVAGDIPNIQSSTDNDLITELAPEECDAVEKNESPAGDSDSLLSKEDMEAIEETFASHSVSFTVNDGIETKTILNENDQLRENTVFEVEGRPSSPSVNPPDDRYPGERLKQHGTESPEETADGATAVTSQSLYDKDSVAAEAHRTLGYEALAEQVEVQDFPNITDSENARRLSDQQGVAVHVTESFGVDSLDMSLNSAPKEHLVEEHFIAVADVLPEASSSASKHVDVKFQRCLELGVVGAEEMEKVESLKNGACMEGDDDTLSKEADGIRPIKIDGIDDGGWKRDEAFVLQEFGGSSGEFHAVETASHKALNKSGEEGLQPHVNVTSSVSMENVMHPPKTVGGLFGEEQLEEDNSEKVATEEGTLNSEGFSLSINFVPLANQQEYQGESEDDHLKAADITELSEPRSEDADNANNNNGAELEYGADQNINLSLSGLSQGFEVKGISENNEVSQGLEKLNDSADSSCKGYAQDDESNKYHGGLISGSYEETWVEDWIQMGSEIETTASDGAQVGPWEHHEENIGHVKCGDFLETNVAEALGNGEEEMKASVVPGSSNAESEKACPCELDMSSEAENLSVLSSKSYVGMGSEAIFSADQSEAQEERRILVQESSEASKLVNHETFLLNSSDIEGLTTIESKLEKISITQTSTVAKNCEESYDANIDANKGENPS